MTRQEFIEKFVLAAAPKWCSPSDSNAICLNVATASVYYDLIHADDPAPEEPDANCQCPGCSLAREEAEAFVKEALKPS